MRPSPAAADLQPTLFPILSVLVCLLGTLILMMGAVTSVSLGPGRTVLINVTGASSPRRKQPTYLEWDGTALTVHPSRTRVPIDVEGTDLSQAEISDLLRRHSGVDDVMPFYWAAVDAKYGAQIAATPLAQLLDEVAAEASGRYLVVFVRPSGFASFVHVRNFLIRRHIDIGYEPIEQGYRVRVK
jgi:hypothetical protein